MLKTFELNSKFQEPYYTTETTTAWNTAVQTFHHISIYSWNIIETRGQNIYHKLIQHRISGQNIFQQTSKSPI